MNAQTSTEQIIPFEDTIMAALQSLIFAANAYEGENIYQELFYQSDLVDIDATADAAANVVVLRTGERLVFDEQRRVWH
jgi:hypothetical protein